MCILGTIEDSNNQLGTEYIRYNVHIYEFIRYIYICHHNIYLLHTHTHIYIYIEVPNMYVSMYVYRYLAYVYIYILIYPYLYICVYIWHCVLASRRHSQSNGCLVTYVCVCVCVCVCARARARVLGIAYSRLGDTRKAMAALSRGAGSNFLSLEGMFFSSQQRQLLCLKRFQKEFCFVLNF
jgi:hypothetical protein